MSVTLSVGSGRDRNCTGGRADLRVPVGVRHLAVGKVERQRSKRGKARSQVFIRYVLSKIWRPYACDRWPGQAKGVCICDI